MRFDLIKVIKCHIDWFTSKYSKAIPGLIVVAMILLIVGAVAAESFITPFVVVIVYVGIGLLAFIVNYYNNFYIKIHALKAHRIKNINLDRKTSPYYLKTIDSLNDASFYMFQELVFGKYIEGNEVRIDAIKKDDYDKPVDFDICKDCGINEQFNGNCPYSYCLACDKRLMLNDTELAEITKTSNSIFIDAHSFAESVVVTKEQANE